MDEQPSSWTEPSKTTYSDKDRTKDLADEFSIIKYPFMNDYPQSNIFAPLERRLLDSGNGITIQNLLDYLKKHPDMLKYVFDENGKMSKIIVDPNRTFTFLDDSFRRQCNMSYGITEMLKLIIENSKFSDWQPTGNKTAVEMNNETFCVEKKYKGEGVKTEPLQISTGYGDTSVSAGGGSKSRRRHRRHAHKTRRGRGRGRSRKPKSNAKSKTHRHRRHSRVRKHKKYTRKH
jgi:hypothetical protein